MYTFFYYLLTVAMFVNCALLILVVLAQLPKKEAGAGMAFGGAASDALFGAGSGNVLTKITKYLAGVFFVLAIGMAVMGAHRTTNSSAAALSQAVTQGGGSLAPAVAPQAPSSSTAPSAPQAPSGGFLTVPSDATPAGTNAAKPTNAPAATVKTNK